MNKKYVIYHPIDNLICIAHPWHTDFDDIEYTVESIYGCVWVYGATLKEFGWINPGEL